VDYYCNPQCIWVWGNSDFPTPFSFMYNCLGIFKLNYIFLFELCILKYLNFCII
jgi:hypothetical protein